MRTRDSAMAATTMLLLFFSASSSQATHFRYGHFSAIHDGPGTIRVTVQGAFRRDGFGCIDHTTPALHAIPCSEPDGFPGVGDVVAEFIGGSVVDWGDGTAPTGSSIGPLLFAVTAIDPAANWWFGFAMDPGALPTITTSLPHSYTASGSFDISLESCCRIARFDTPNEHLNNPELGYRIAVGGSIAGSNASPVSAVPPIVDCPIGAICSFSVPVADAENDTITFRLATAAEAGDPAFVQPGPPHAPSAADIDSSSGLYRWDTTGATLASNAPNLSLYSTQVIVEDGSNQVALDFLIRLVPDDVDPPDLESPPDEAPVCETTQVLPVGGILTFDISANDPDVDDDVTLNAVGMPPGATMTPVLPTEGNPVNSRFEWRPTRDQAGVWVIQLTASSDPGGGFALCPVTVRVDPPDIDHFMTYKVRPTRGAARIPRFGPVALADELGTSDYLVLRTSELSLAAEKNDEGIFDTDTHLQEFRVRGARGTPRFQKISNVRVQNQCNDVLVELVNVQSALVPAATDPTTPPSAPTEGDHQVDHQLCYKAKLQRRDGAGHRLPIFPKGMQVVVDDAFQTRRYDLKKITKVCNPAALSGAPEILSGPSRGDAWPIDASTIRHPDWHLVCYRAKRSTREIPQSGCGAIDPNDRGARILPRQDRHARRQGIHVGAHFGASTVDTAREFELCIPSLVTYPGD